MRPITLLGPQRLKPTIIESVKALKIKGSIATVTAGWQEREDEDEELDEHLGGKTVNLRLYHRTAAIMKADPKLHDALRDRQNRLKELQKLYRLRLGHELQAARDLLAVEGDGDILLDQQEAALEDLRRLDQSHLHRVRRIHDDFEHEHSLDTHEEVAKHRAEVQKTLSECAALAVAGGHVAILLNRLRLLDVAKASKEMPLFLWSAGAMAFSERVVLFHDSPPQGQGNPEVLEVGLGCVKGLIPLPHARRRLRLYDRTRVSLFARRFQDSQCIAFDEGSHLRFDRKGKRDVERARRLLATGELEEMRP